MFASLNCWQAVAYMYGDSFLGVFVNSREFFLCSALKDTVLTAAVYLILLHPLHSWVLLH